MDDKFSARPLALDFDNRATLEEVLEAVTIIYNRTGCNPCGRLSLFLKAEEVVDPAIDRLREIGSLRSVQELGAQVGIRTAGFG